MLTFDINTATITPAASAAAGKALADKVDGYFINTAEDLGEVTAFQMVQLHNLLIARPDVQRNLAEAGREAPATVNRFSNREAATRRVMALIPLVSPPAPEPVAKKAPAAPKAAKPEAKRPTTSRGVNLTPKSPIRDCRIGSVQALLVDMLSRPEGATLSELRDAQHAHAAAQVDKAGNPKPGKPWKDVTLRSGLNWDINCVKGYGIVTDLTDPRGAVMRLTYPKGVTAPLPHRAMKAK